MNIDKNCNRFYDSHSNWIEHNDVIECMKSIETGTVDLIIADPPYYRVYGDFDFGAFKTEKAYIDWVREWLAEAKRILTDSGTLILWGSVGKRQITFARIAIIIEDEDIFIRQNWITQRNSRGIGSTKNYMSAREDILFLTKSNKYTFNVPYLDEKSTRKDLGFNGKPRTNTHKRASNVWADITEASQSSIERCGHPTVKAQKLCSRLIQAHSNKNDIVFIPFAGSGSEIISAIINNRRVWACEINNDYVNLAIERIYKITGVKYEIHKNSHRSKTQFLPNQDRKRIGIVAVGD